MRDFFVLAIFYLFVGILIGTGPHLCSDPLVDYCYDLLFLLAAAAIVDLSARFTGGAGAAIPLFFLLAPAVRLLGAGPSSGGGATALALTLAPKGGSCARGLRETRMITICKDRPSGPWWRACNAATFMHFTGRWAPQDLSSTPNPIGSWGSVSLTVRELFACGAGVFRQAWWLTPRASRR